MQYDVIYIMMSIVVNDIKYYNILYTYHLYFKIKKKYLNRERISRQNEGTNFILILNIYKLKI